MKIELFLKYPNDCPIAKQSTRFSQKGFAYQSSKIKKAQNFLAIQARKFMSENKLSPIKENVFVYNVIFAFPFPKSWSKKKCNSTIFKSTKPDLDNLEKFLWDSINTICFDDDARIVYKNNITKIYSNNPGVYIYLSDNL